MSRLFPYIILLTLLNSCLAVRFVGWNFADIRDHKKFKNRTISASDSPFYFHTTHRQPSPGPWPPDSLLEFDEMLEKNKTVAFMVVRNDTIIYERYFKGYDSSSVIPSFSMAKSFVGTLVAIAIDEGHIGSLHDPITKYIPELEGPEFDSLTIQHVMDQRSGLAFDERYMNPFSDVAKYYYGRHLKKYILDIEFENEPGKKFNYTSLNTQLLGLILERTTDKKLSVYLEEKIWQPIGMVHPASWSIDKKKEGTEKAFCCLNAIPRDFARFGRLILNEGEWGGKQIIPKWFITSLYDELETFQWYHNQFWFHAEKRIPAIYAQGFLGQYIYVVPSRNLIFIRMGKRYGDVYWPGAFQKMMGLF